MEPIIDKYTSWGKRQIMDFPRDIPPDKFFIWHWNGVKWPNGARSFSYLTNIPASVVLPNMSWKPPYQMRPENLIAFDSYAGAEEFWRLTKWYGWGHKLVEGDSESGYRIGQHADVIRLVGYPEDGMVAIKDWVKHV